MEAGASQNLSDIIINSSFGAYQIKFQSINKEIFTNHYFLIDHNLKSRISSDEKNSVFIKAVESHKSLKSAENVMVQLSEKGMTKNHELVVIGGGYLQDIGTLISSLYMRGDRKSVV
jgi:3-dehydroquinate synthetase